MTPIFRGSISAGKLTLQDKNTFNGYLTTLNGEIELIVRKKRSTRSNLQNDSLHLYFKLVAEALNEAGLDIRAVFKPNVEIPWNTTLVKELLWRNVQKISIQKESTTKITSRDIDIIYDIVNRHIAIHGVHIPFPSKEQTEEYLKSLNETQENM